MDTKIVGFSGRMQSGKDTCCNLLMAIALRNVLKLTPYAELNAEGKIVAEADDGSRNVFNVDSRNPEFMAWMHQNVWGFMRKFSFAEPLKEFCQYTLGLSEEMVWGSADDKSKPTHLLWENMPVVPTGKSGFMTSREVMEYFGSQIMRKMYPNVWADALVRRIEMMQPKYATVCDLRFPNEVQAIKNTGGKVVRLTLVTEEASKNTHISNTALDEDVYDWNNFDFVLDNANITMEESHAVLLDKLIEWDYMQLQELEVTE